MKKYTIFGIILGYILSIAIPAYAITVFNSNQVGTTPSAGEVLQTDGTNSAWVATTTLGLTTGTVTSVAATVPTGLSISGSPITTSGTLAFTLQSGYVIPLTASTTEWATAYGSTTALTPAYIRGLLSGVSPISYNSTTGAFSFLFNTNNTWTGQNTFGNASSTNHTISNALYLPGMANGCLQVGSGIATSTGVNCGSGSGGTTTWLVGNGFLYTATSTDGAVADYFDSGQGQNELFAMNQNVRTNDSVQFFDVDADEDVNVGRYLLVDDGLEGAVAIALNGDIGNGFWSSGANTLNFSTNQLERLRVTSSGLVGIGTTTPATKLHVAGSSGTNPFRVSSSTNISMFEVNQAGALLIANSAGTSGNILQSAGSTGAPTWVTPASLASNINYLVLESAGLRTSTTTDFIKAAYFTATSTTASTFTNASSTNHTIANIFYLPGMANGCLQVTSNIATSTGTSCGGGSGNSAWTIGSGKIYNATSTDLVGIGTTSPTTTLFVQGNGGTNPFAVASSTGTNMLTLLQDGSFGIGTTTPNKPLHVWGNVSGGIMKIERFNAATTGVLGTQIIKGRSLGNMTDGFGTGQTFVIEDDAGVENLIADVSALRNGADNTGALFLRPYTLGSATWSGVTIDGSTLTGSIGTTTSGGTWGIVGTSSKPTTRLLAVATSTGTLVFNIEATGNVGVGSTTPSTALSVVGQIVGSIYTGYGTATSTLAGPLSTQTVHSKTFPITAVTSAGDFGTVWKTVTPITIVAVKVIQIGATNVVGQLEECDSNGENCVVIDSSDITATSGEASDDGTLSNPSVDAGDYIGWHTTSVSGTNTRVSITFYYKDNF
jgi:hypothetical protein